MKEERLAILRMLEKGNRILLATFGAGFTWASMIVEI